MWKVFCETQNCVIFDEIHLFRVSQVLQLIYWCWYCGNYHFMYRFSVYLQLKIELKFILQLSDIFSSKWKVGLAEEQIGMWRNSNPPETV